MDLSHGVSVFLRETGQLVKENLAIILSTIKQSILFRTLVCLIISITITYLIYECTAAGDILQLVDQAFKIVSMCPQTTTL